MRGLLNAMLAAIAIFVLLSGLHQQGLISPLAYTILLVASILIIITTALFAWVAGFFRIGITITSLIFLFFLTLAFRPDLLKQNQEVLVTLVIIVIVGYGLLRILGLRPR